jgi:hypothetical protein
MTPVEDIKLVFSRSSGYHLGTIASRLTTMSEDTFWFRSMTRSGKSKEAALRNVMKWASRTPVEEVESEIRSGLS